MIGRPEKLILVTVALLVLASSAWLMVLWLWAPEPLKVQVARNGQVVLTIDLTEASERQWTLEGPLGYNVITAQGGRVAVTDSNCPGGDCVAVGWISRPGQAAICLPHRLSLRVLGRGDWDGFVQ